MPFTPKKPGGTWLRRDIAGVLNALAGKRSGQARSSLNDHVVDYQRGYRDALDDIAQALGIEWREPLRMGIWSMEPVDRTFEVVEGRAVRISADPSQAAVEGNPLLPE